jgi:hypothetical protein
VCLFVDAEKATEDNPDGYGIARLCRVLGINRSTCYAWLASRPDAVERQCAQDESAGQIRAIHVTSRGAYGAPPMNAGPAGPRATGYSARDGSLVREGKRDRHQQHPARRG